MLNSQTPSTSTSQDRAEDDHLDDNIRDIHALTPTHAPPSSAATRRRDTWDTASHRSLSVASDGASSENFTTMSREFNALVLAGSSMEHTGGEGDGNGNNLARIREDEVPEEETNPLAIVPDNHQFEVSASPPRRVGGEVTAPSVQRVKKEEVETKISAWQNAKVAEINNRFKREDAIINGWENEQVQKATSWMKKIERKLEEKRAKALEKMQNDIAKAHRKAEERRASAEAKRGTKVAKILELANFMRAVGKPPTKRSFF